MMYCHLFIFWYYGDKGSSTIGVFPKSSGNLVNSLKSANLTKSIVLGNFKDSFNICLNIFLQLSFLTNNLVNSAKVIQEKSIESLYMFGYDLVSTRPLHPISIRFFLAAQVYGSFVINYITAIIVRKHILLPTNSDDFHTKTST